MNNVDNSKKIILLSQLSRYNPMYEVTGEKEIEIFNRYNGEKSLEARKAYDELILKKRVPFNREYVDFYKKAIDTKPEDLTLLLDSYTVNQMIGTREIVEEMVNTILAVKKYFSTPNQEIAKFALQEVVKKLSSSYKEIKKGKEEGNLDVKTREERWLYEHWLERIIILGFRRRTLFTEETTLPIIEVVRKYNNLRLKIAREYYGENSVEFRIWENRVNLEDKFLNNKREFREFCEKQSNTLLAEYSSGNKDAGLIRDQLIRDRVVYVYAPENSATSVFEEFLTMFCEGCPHEFIYYRTKNELNEALEVSKKFLKLLTNDNIQTSYERYMDYLIASHQKGIINECRDKLKDCFYILDTCGIRANERFYKYYNSHL